MGFAVKALGEVKIGWVGAQILKHTSDNLLIHIATIIEEVRERQNE
jgi:hypothetical protein